MGNFFANIYYLLVDMFGQHLSDYLWGYDCQTQGFNANVVYLPIGLTMMLLTIALCIVYYFAINHPRLNKWWHWLVASGITVIINFLIGGIWVNNHLQTGLIPDCLRCETLADGTTIEHVTNYHCWMFGLANGIISFVVFFILSAIVKRWSRNCRHTPWRSLYPKRNK